MNRAPKPLLCYITDRKQLPGGDPLPVIRAAVAAGVDFIQIREKDLATRPLLELARAAVAMARPDGIGASRSATRVLVNDRLDVALAAGADGVHLGTESVAVGVVREQYPDLLIGASSHNLEEITRAAKEGANFAVFGPVFETASKLGYGPAVGLDALREAVKAVKIPVLALGGVTVENAKSCLDAGAAGIAAISLFQTAGLLAPLVEELGRLR
ncbi:MAG TPA: thiamine phosphate synthase [Candidatus Acidoferrales bacterium]